MFGWAFPAHGLVGKKRRADVEHPDVDMLTLTAHLPPRQRGQNGNRGVHPGHDVDDGHSDLLRPRSGLAVRLAGDAHEAAHALDHKVVGGLVAARTALPETGDRAIDEGRVDRAQILVAEAVFRQRAGLEILQHDVGPRGKRSHDALAFGVGKIDGDRAFAAVDRQQIAGVAGIASGLVLEERGTPAAGVVARAGTLDLHHVGTKVGQNLSGPGARHYAAEIEHADMRERPGHVSTGLADVQLSSTGSVARTEGRWQYSSCQRAIPG